MEQRSMGVFGQTVAYVSVLLVQLSGADDATTLQHVRQGTRDPALLS